MYEGLPYAFYLYGSIAVGAVSLVTLGFLVWSRVRGAVDRIAFIDGLLVQLGLLALIASIPSPPFLQIMLLPVATGMMGLAAGRRWSRAEEHETHESVGDPAA